MIQVSKFKACLAHEIEGAIHFRQSRAEQYPHDGRNQSSAECLENLGNNLEALGEDDPALQECFSQYRAKHEAAGNLNNNWLVVGLWYPRREVENSTDPMSTPDLFARYGFDAPDNGDIREFLESLSRCIGDWNSEDLRVE